ncbi:hypothetical protein C8F01DRAFT_1111172, partial [Mycena amicta]
MGSDSADPTVTTNEDTRIRRLVEEGGIEELAPLQARLEKVESELKALKATALQNSSHVIRSHLVKTAALIASYLLAEENCDRQKPTARTTSWTLDEKLIIETVNAPDKDFHPELKDEALQHTRQQFWQRCRNEVNAAQKHHESLHRTPALPPIREKRQNQVEKFLTKNFSTIVNEGNRVAHEVRQSEVFDWLDTQYAGADLEDLKHLYIYPPQDGAGYLLT